MSLPAWHEEPISKKHDRKSFDCGDPSMNDFFARYARQSHESGAAKTFLAIDNRDNRTILGFYSLAPGAVAYSDTPELVRRGLARHDVPGFRLARIAIDLRWPGQGLGGQLLAAAARRCLRAATEVGGVVLIIDAKKRTRGSVVRQLRRCCFEQQASDAAILARHLRSRPGCHRAAMISPSSSHGTYGIRAPISRFKTASG